MALIKCRECGQQVSDRALTCPHCGAPPTPKRAKRALVAAAMAGALAAALAAGLLVARQGSSESSDPALIGAGAAVIGAVVVGLAIVLLVAKLRGGR